MIKFREHTLVLGATGTGKGVLVHSLHEKWLQAGMRVFLLCNKDHEYGKFADHPRLFKTKDQARLLEEVKKLQAPKEGFVDTLVIIDEAWDWDWKNREIGLQYIPNAARAHGVEMWCQSQFPTQMPPTVRGNCDNIYCFRLKPDGAEWAAKQYGNEFSNVVKLDKGRYLAQLGLDDPFLGRSFYFDQDGNFQKA